MRQRNIVGSGSKAGGTWPVLPLFEAWMKRERGHMSWEAVRGILEQDKIGILGQVKDFDHSL